MSDPFVEQLAELQRCAEERLSHCEGAFFKEFFNRLLAATESCAERDVLRANEEHLWQTWKMLHG